MNSECFQQQQKNKTNRVRPEKSLLSLKWAMRNTSRRRARKLGRVDLEGPDVVRSYPSSAYIYCRERKKKTFDITLCQEQSPEHMQHHMSNLYTLSSCSLSAIHGQMDGHKVCAKVRPSGMNVTHRREDKRNYACWAAAI